MIDRRFDMMDFEQSLKDHADQFRLTPSKRIWNGIYNNLHPGSRWPSMTMGIAFILTLISIGYLNNASKKIVPQEVSIKTTEGISGNLKSTNNKNLDLERHSGSGMSLPSPLDNNPESVNSVVQLSNDKTANGPSNVPDASQTRPAGPSLIVNIAYLSNDGAAADLAGRDKPAESSTDYVFVLDPGIQNILEEKNEISFNPDNNTMAENADSFIASVALADEINSSTQLKLNSSSAVSAHLQQPEKTFSKKIHRRWSKKIEWIYYITPTVSSASFNESDVNSSIVNYSPLVVFQRSIANGMMYNAKPGFETGAKMTYALSKKWKVVTGFNLNYSDYNIVSNPIHPTFATLMLKDESTGALYSKNYITFYGDGQSYSQIGLTNYSLQFSIPLGIEYQVWGNKKMQINIETAVQPSVVLQGNSFIISSDKRNYVQDPDLMRKMNLGGNFGAFISFGSNKIKWHIGPDLHYQLFSTFKDVYPSREHFINYGIRIGISKKY